MGSTIKIIGLLRAPKYQFFEVQRNATALVKGNVRAKIPYDKKLFSAPLVAENYETTRRKRALDDWNVMKPQKLLKALQLSKPNLTALITLTTVGGYVMSPAGLSFSLIPCIFGTALLSASANCLNQLLESPYDAQMSRTWARLLVVHRLTPLQAFGFAFSTGTLGAVTLWFGCNSLTVLLGLLNVFLYTGIYTPMKRYHAGCTWAGAVVGAIPPLMGYSAAGSLGIPGFVLAAVVYCWQFPHFHSLSWNLRGDYSRAGYRVVSVVNEGLCRASSIRNTLALLPICSLAAPLSGLTPWSFALESLPLNLYFAYLATRFYKTADANTSRSLFVYSLLYLPLIFILMFIARLETIFRSLKKSES